MLNSVKGTSVEPIRLLNLKSPHLYQSCQIANNKIYMRLLIVRSSIGWHHKEHEKINNFKVYMNQFGAQRNEVLLSGGMFIDSSRNVLAS